MGIYAGMMNEPQRRAYSDRELFRRYVRRLIPFKKSVKLISLFILISTIAEIINPLLIGIAVNELSKVNRNFVIILSTGIGYFILSITIWIMFLLRRKELGKFVPFFLEKLRMDIFDKFHVSTSVLGPMQLDRVSIKIL